MTPQVYWRKSVVKYFLRRPVAFFFLLAACLSLSLLGCQTTDTRQVASPSSSSGENSVASVPRSEGQLCRFG
jgi:hypothetical protein